MSERSDLPQRMPLLDRLAPNLGHDGTLSAQILVAETEEVVDDKRLVTIADRVKVHVVVVVGEEQQTAMKAS